VCLLNKEHSFAPLVHSMHHGRNVIRSLVKEYLTSVMPCKTIHKKKKKLKQQVYCRQKENMKMSYSEKKLDNNGTGLENKSQKVFVRLSWLLGLGCQRLRFAVQQHPCRSRVIQQLICLGWEVRS
jgi:hypothetical protein